MEFLRGDEYEDDREKALMLLNKIYGQIDELKKEPITSWKKDILKAQDVKSKRKIVRKLMESNLPACAAILDELMEESKSSVFELLEYLSSRQRVAMSLESFEIAQKYAEEAHLAAKNLYQSTKLNFMHPGVEVYDAYFRSCIDLFTVCRYRGRLESATNCLDDAKNVAREISNENYLHQVQILEGEICLAKGLLNKAISEFFTPLLNKANLSEENRGLLLQKLGNACRSAAQWGAAKAHLRKSIEIAQQLEDRISEHDRITDLGNVYRSEGRIADAVGLQSTHMLFAYERGDLWGLTVACFNMGFAYYSVTPRPSLDRALYLLTMKYELAVKTCNEILRGMALNNLGKIFCAKGHYDVAVKALKECAEVAKKTGNVGGEGMAYGNLGTAYRALGQFDEAIIHHEMYRKNAIVRGDDGGVAIMQRELAWDYLLKKDFKKAEDQARNSILTSELIRQKLGTEDSSRLANFDKNQAEAYNLLQVSLVRQGRVEEALAFSEFARARAITDIVRDRSSHKENSWLWKDEIIFRQGVRLHEQADDILSDFFKTADELNTNFLVFSIVTDYPTKEKKEKFLYIWLVKCLRDLGADDHRISFRQVKLEYEVHGNLVADEKFFTSLTRSFRLRNMQQTGIEENLTKKNVQETFPPADDDNEEKIDLIVPQGKSVERFAELLRTLFFETETAEEISTDRSQAGTRNPDCQTDVENPTQDTDTSSDDEEKTPVVNVRYADYGTWDTEGLKQLSLLYDVCIGPIEECLPPVRGNYVPRITIIPQEFLFSVPFCALYDEKQQYLIERCILSYAPSLRALYHLQQRLKELRTLQGERKLKLFAVGDPKMTQPNVPDLPQSGLEAQHVQNVFGCKQCHLAVRDEAKKSLVLSEMKNADIMHLATHASPGNTDAVIIEGGYLMEGCLLLAPSNEKCDGVLNAQEIANASCNCQLVLLSCCETGLGKLTGDGVVGLYRAFFAAGASSILVTLWKISDDITPLFMEKFYSVFKDSEDVPLALREAMLFFLREKKHPPHEWAAFSVVGAALSRKESTLHS